MRQKEEHTERILVTRLKDGDEKAFLTIYNRYSGVLWSFLSKLHIEQQDIEDIIQQTFVKLWEKREQLDSDQSLKSYLITIAKNDIYNKIKHQIIRKKHQEYVIHFQSKEVQATSSELTEILYCILDRLPEKRREVYEMSRIKGYSNQEIADILGISKSTVENHINNSSAYVKKILRTLGFVFIFLIFC